MVDMLTGEGMTFSHFDAPFKYKNRILSVKSGKTYGNVVGLTFSGAYNTANEDISIKGMIAPDSSGRQPAGRQRRHRVCRQLFDYGQGK